MWGRATLVMLVSSTCITVTSITEKVMSHLRVVVSGTSVIEGPVYDAAVDIETPFDRYRDVVRPEWIDANGHLNMGYYVVVFDFATDAFFEWVGIGQEHRRAHPITTFC